MTCREFLFVTAAVGGGTVAGVAFWTTRASVRRQPRLVRKGP